MKRNLHSLHCILSLILLSTFYFFSIPTQAQDLKKESVTNLKVITYNTHGGHGNLQKNLRAFKDLIKR